MGGSDASLKNAVMSKTMSKVNLDAPAFGAEAEKINSESTAETVTAEVSQTESEEKDQEQSSSSDTQEVVEQKVPYSRFSEAVRLRREAEEAAEETRARLEELEEKLNSRESANSEPYEEAVRKRIIKLYGDNDTAKEIIEIELGHRRDIEAIAERKANEAYERRQRESETAEVTNQRAIERKLEDFQLNLGRELSPKEEEALLTIADEYTPTDEDGNYVGGQPISFDKAWSIYELQLEAQGKSSKEARKSATNATSARSQGEASTSAESNDDFRPGNWGKWRNRKI